MSYPFSYLGLKDGGTFPLDATTATAIASDIKSIIGKAVTYTGTTTPEVGYGSSGDDVAGIVTAIEKREVGSKDYVVTVEWAQTFEDVPTASGATVAVVGKGLVVNGSGAVITTTNPSSAVCLAVNSTSCIIRVL